MIFQLTCSLLYYIFIQHHSVVNSNIMVQLNKIKFFKGVFTVQYTKFCIGSVLKQREVLYITGVDYALLCLPDKNIGLTADVTIKRRLHLISLLLCTGVCVYLMLSNSKVIGVFREGVFPSCMGICFLNFKGNLCHFKNFIFLSLEILGGYVPLLPH